MIVLGREQRGFSNSLTKTSLLKLSFRLNDLKKDKGNDKAINAPCPDDFRCDAVSGVAVAEIQSPKDRFGLLSK